MYHTIIAIYFFTFLLHSNLFAQEDKKTFHSPFTVHSVTYNGSDSPNECWESVEWGITIRELSYNLFFSMNNEDLENLRNKIKDHQVQIDVVYYDEPINGSGALGFVTKVTLDGEVIFGQE
jgi:hypothetical protein